MTRAHQVGFSSAVVLAGVAAFIGSRYLTTKVNAAGPAPAFTLQSVKTARDFSSGVTRQIAHVYGVRSDGSVVQHNVVTLANPPRVTTQLFLADVGKSVVISHSLQRVSTRYLSPKQLERRRERRPVDTYCSSVANAMNGFRLQGTEKLLGLDVVKYESRNAESIHTIYVAPQLSCSEVKATTSWLKDGVVVEVTSDEPQVITLGEPDPRLFIVPAGYKESKPSEIRLGLWESVNPAKPVPECLLRSNERDDAGYSKARQLGGAGAK